MNEPYLLMWFEAPLQAWGHESRFGRRVSLDFPTKSGVLGLLCCALGYGGEQVEWLSRWADSDMFIQAYAPEDQYGNSIPRLSMLRDFHMVGSGYDHTDPWQTLHIPKKSDGSRAVGGGSKMTYRYYLQDMAFAVALQGERHELERLQTALQNPVWDLYLGRKNCVPTEFIEQGIYADRSTALQSADRLAANSEKPIKRIAVFQVLQGEHEDGEVLTLNDVPVQFGTNKKYRDRKVTVIKYG